VTADYQSKALYLPKSSPFPHCAAITYIFVQFKLRIRIYFSDKFLILFFNFLEFSHLTFGGLRADLGHACTYQAARSVGAYYKTMYCSLYNFF